MKIGDKITLIGTTTITLTTVQDIPDERERVGFMAWISNHGSEQFSFTDEGEKWIRGHHMMDAPEVQAAQAALALSAEHPKKRRPARSTRGIIGVALGTFLAHELVKSYINGDLTKKP